MKAGGDIFKMGRTIRNGWGLRSQIEEIRRQREDRRGQVEEIRRQRKE
jgi:hypothetical protein